MKIKNKNIIFFLALISIFFVFNFADAAPSWWPLVPCGLNSQPAGVTLKDANGQIHDYTQPCQRCDTLVLLKNIIDFILEGLMPPVAALFYLWAGFLILIGGVQSARIQQGRDIFKNTSIGILILVSSWLITNTILKNLATNDPNIVPTAWYQLQCTNPAPVVLPPIGGGGGGGGANLTCNQNFGISPSSGCSSLSSCINVSSYTPTHGCQSNNGVCLLSSQAASRAQRLVSVFNSLSGGSCQLKISSAIQVNGGPSISTCHKPGNPNSGTCADFNVIPSSQSCIQNFYQAAQSSGGVASFLDEYTCPVSTTTGGDIHVNF